MPSVSALGTDVRATCTCALTACVSAMLQLTILALDSGRPSLQTPASLTIFVNRNPSPPRFDDEVHYATIGEYSGVGTSVIQLLAHDDDSPQVLPLSASPQVPPLSASPQVPPLSASPQVPLRSASPQVPLRSASPQVSQPRHRSQRLLLYMSCSYAATCRCRRAVGGYRTSCSSVKTTPATISSSVPRRAL